MTDLQFYCNVYEVLMQLSAIGHVHYLVIARTEADLLFKRHLKGFCVQICVGCYETVVVQGVLSARGERILFADADGATTFEDLDKVDKEMSACLQAADDVVVCGSRAHLEVDSIAQVCHR